MRVIRLILPILLTLVLFGGIFVLTMNRKSAPVPVPGYPTGTGSEIVETTENGIPYTSEEARGEAMLYGQAAILHTLWFGGNGVILKPTPEEMQRWLDAANQTAIPIENISLLSAPYTRGNSLLLADTIDPTNALTYRWNQNEHTSRVEPRTVAAGILGAVALADSYAAAGGTLEALMLARQASEGVKFLEEKMKLTSGLFASAWQGDKIVSTTVNLRDECAVMSAYAALYEYASSNPLYYDSPVESDAILERLDAVVQSVVTYTEANDSVFVNLSTEDAAICLGALTKYQSVAVDLSKQGATLSVIQQLTALLEIPVLTGLSTYQLAQMVHGYAAAYAATEDVAYQGAAVAIWQTLESRWDEARHMYIDVNISALPTVEFTTPREAATYLRVASEIGPLLGAASSYDAQTRVADVLNTYVKTSGLLPSETDDAEAIHPSDLIPTVSLVKKSPVFIARVIYLPGSGTWETLDANVDAGPAMELATVLVEIGDKDELPMVLTQPTSAQIVDTETAQ